MRNRKNIISLDVDSALALMQEIYIDIVEQKNTASLIIKKMNTFMKEADDMSLIGPVIKEQQKILQDCSAKKLDIVKLQSVLIKQAGGQKNDFGGNTKMELSPEDRQILSKLLDEKDDKKSSEDNSVKYGT
jgi:isochorismate hydrolase